MQYEEINSSRGKNTSTLLQSNSVSHSNVHTCICTFAQTYVCMYVCLLPLLRAYGQKKNNSKKNKHCLAIILPILRWSDCYTYTHLYICMHRYIHIMFEFGANAQTHLSYCLTLNFESCVCISIYTYPGFQ